MYRGRRGKALRGADLGTRRWSDLLSGLFNPGKLPPLTMDPRYDLDVTEKIKK
jgi:hypothetical protein